MEPTWSGTLTRGRSEAHSDDLTLGKMLSASIGEGVVYSKDKEHKHTSHVGNTQSTYNRRRVQKSDKTTDEQMMMNLA